MIHLPAMASASPSRNELPSSRRLATTLRTTLGSFLCSALRDELEVDCVLFDGGNIRGAISGERIDRSVFGLCKWCIYVYFNRNIYIYI